jgi:hypothetical protein
MSTTGRPQADAPAASEVAERLGSAGFVRLVAAAHGDALASAGLLAGSLDATDTPYQASVAPLPADAERTTDADLTVTLGWPAASADLTLGVGVPSSTVAYDVATRFGDADPILALAGMVAHGTPPQGTPLEDARATGLDQRPGIAVPTADPVDGLAHSTLVHGPFSGSTDAAGELLADVDLGGDVDETAHSRIASLVAVAVAGDEDGIPRGGKRVERFLRPYAGGPVGTVGGYADLLDGLASEDGGLGLAVALGRVDPEEALPAWREHSKRAHAAVGEATTGRYDGLFVARCDADVPVGTVARLVRDFRSPEPTVLVVADGRALALSTGETNVGRVMDETATAVDGIAAGTPHRARARFDVDDTEFVVAFREAQ